MAATTPTWTDSVSILAAQTVARGNTVRGTLDLRTKRGAYIFVGIARGGTTGLTNGVVVRIRRTVGNDATLYHSSVVELVSQTAGANSTTISGSDSNSGQPAINVASATGFAAGQVISIEASDHSRLEFCTVSKVAGAVITADANLKSSHTTAQADLVRNNADNWTIWIDGGALVEVVVDYGDDAAGDSVTVIAQAQTWDSDTTV